MILIIMLFFFGLLVLLSGCIMFPPVRQCFEDAGRQIFSRLSSQSLKTIGLVQCFAYGAKLSLRERVLIAFKSAVNAKWILLALSMVILVPPLVAVVLNVERIPEYQDVGYNADGKIIELLKGEQLVPPVMLPPEVFVTREVELVRPLLAGASRNWELLDPQFSQRLLYVFKVMREQHGYEMALLEGYRTPERQAELQASGAGVVTNAGAYQSYHQYGLASDCAFLREGKLVISEKDPWAMRGYELYGQVAESVGLTWGGRWKLMDFGHVELRKPGVLGKRP